MQLGNYAFDKVLALELAEKVTFAIIILLITWALAKVSKWGFARLVDKVELFQRSTSTGESIGTSLGKIVSLIVWLFGLLAVLQVFDLGGVMTPVQTLLNNVMGFIPNLVGAGLIFFIGAMVARIVRDIVVTTLQTVDFDKWANKSGVDSVTGNTAISNTIGIVVYVLIIIPVAIMALDALRIESLSAPSSDMLRLILNAIPLIIGAAILLGIGYLISRFVVQALNELLPGLGVDRSLGELNVLPDSTTLSNVVARVTQVAIMLFFAIAATRLLGFPELTAILDEVLELGGRVVFGSVVIIAGFLIARVLSGLIAGSGESKLAADIVRWVTIVLFSFMGLEFMGVGDEIVRLAFGALVIGGAVAGALAFGLGGRDWAARRLQKLDENH